MSCLVFFKQKTAYEMRISDWSSDVCSSDLTARAAMARRWRLPDQCQLDRYPAVARPAGSHSSRRGIVGIGRRSAVCRLHPDLGAGDDQGTWLRSSEERLEGKSVSVRVDLGGRRIIKKKKKLGRQYKK